MMHCRTRHDRSANRHSDPRAIANHRLTTPSCRSRWPSSTCAAVSVRLGPAVDEILSRHAYPQPVAKLLGEALVLTVMLGSALKIEGRFILQTQSDGPVRMLVVDFIAPDKVRACARFDKDRVAAAIAAGETGGPRCSARGTSP